MKPLLICVNNPALCAASIRISANTICDAISRHSATRTPRMPREELSANNSADSR
jgi:hypothetical protein